MNAMWSVRRTCRVPELGGKRICKDTAVPLTQPWCVCRAGFGLSDEAAVKVAPLVVVEACKDLNALAGNGEPPDDREVGIIYVGGPEGADFNSYDPIFFGKNQYVAVVRRGPLEVGIGLGQADEGRILGLWNGDRLAPTVSRYLHAKYGTSPAPKPKTKSFIATPAPDPAAGRRREYADRIIALIAPNGVGPRHRDAVMGILRQYAN